MCFGAFDYFHEGHRFFLEESQKHGEIFYIIIARDANITKIKGSKPMFSENMRAKKIKEAFHSAHIDLGDLKDFHAPIRRWNPDILCFGYDQKVDVKLLEKKFPDITCKKIKAFKPEVFKSSLLKRKQEGR